MIFGFTVFSWDGHPALLLFTADYYQAHMEEKLRGWPLVDVWLLTLRWTREPKSNDLWLVYVAQ